MISSEEAWRILEEINRIERKLHPIPLYGRMKEELEADLMKWKLMLEEDGIFIKWLPSACKYVFDYTKTPATPLNPTITIAHQSYQRSSTTGEMRAIPRETGPELSAIGQLEALIARRRGYEQKYSAIELTFSQMTTEEARETLNRLIAVFRNRCDSTS